MAYENALRSITLVATGNLTASQYMAVGVDASGQAVLAASGTALTTIGVLQNDPNADEAATVGISGVSKVVCGGAVTAGDALKLDASAKFITGGVAADAVAVALEDGSGDGSIIAAVLKL